MHFSAFLAATAAVLASASPTPISSVAAAGIEKTWNVTSWEAGCSRSGCYAGFAVSAPASNGNPEAPALNATCRIENEGGAYSECTWKGAEPAAGKRVVSRLLPAVRVDGMNTIARFEVSFQYPHATTPGAYYNWTAQGNSSYNQFVEPPKTFNIPVTKIFGIA
ncbi:hypothetical protein RB595_008807 [Gaeumannomyces hyphopodioides]